MKFYIAKGEKVDLSLPQEVANLDAYDYARDPYSISIAGLRRNGKFEVTKLLPRDKESQQSQVAKIIRSKLEDALNQPVDSEIPDAGCGSGRGVKRSRLQGSLNLAGQSKSTFSLELTFAGFQNLNRTSTTETIPILVSGVSTGLLSHFKNNFQVEPAHIRMRITGQVWFQRRIPGGGEANSMRRFGTFNTIAKCLRNGESDDSYIFDDNSARISINPALTTPNVQSPRSLWNDPNVSFFGTVTVELTLEGVTEDFFIDSSVADRMSINKKLLREAYGMGSDIKIVADNGIIIHCHKGFLLAHSQVFASMLNGNFAEAEEKVIKLPGKTEEAIRALLAYLYCWDTTAPFDNPLIAVELYTIAHEYDIKPLQNCMAKLLGRRKAEDWLDTETALALFPLVGSLDDLDGMKCAVYRYFKINAKKLGESESFREMFEKTPSIAIDLFGEVCGWRDSS